MGVSYNQLKTKGLVMNYQLQLDFGTTTATLSGGHKPARQHHQERTEWTNSPLNEELLRFFADKGLLEECDFDTDEKFTSDYEEPLWNEFRSRNNVYPGEPDYPTEESVENKREEMDTIWFNAWIRVATALKEMQEQPNYCRTPDEYISDLWSTYALNSSIHFERPLEYRIFTHCFDGWLRYNRTFNQ